DLVLADGIFDPMFEVGIVVDFHNDDADRGLLEVDAVKAIADLPCGAHGHIDDLGRRLLDCEGAEAAFGGGAIGAVLDDLPMAARHAILANEQWLTPPRTPPPPRIPRP